VVTIRLRRGRPADRCEITTPEAVTLDRINAVL
jgi:hypothetical protein